MVHPGPLLQAAAGETAGQCPQQQLQPLTEQPPSRQATAVTVATPAAVATSQQGQKQWVALSGRAGGTSGLSLSLLLYTVF